MAFTPAKFNTGLNETETTIVTRYLTMLPFLTYSAWVRMSSLGTSGKYNKIILNHTELGSTLTM